MRSFGRNFDRFSYNLVKTFLSVIYLGQVRWPKDSNNNLRFGVFFPKILVVGAYKSNSGKKARSIFVAVCSTLNWDRMLNETVDFTFSLLDNIEWSKLFSKSDRMEISFTHGSVLRAILFFISFFAYNFITPFTGIERVLPSNKHPHAVSLREK